MAKKETSVRIRKGVSPEAVKKKITKDGGDLAPAVISGAHPTFSYHGGRIVYKPQVYGIYLGDWSAAANQARELRLNQYLSDLVRSKYMNIMSQYGCSNTGDFIKSVNYNTAVPANLTDANFHSILQTMINGGQIPEPFNPSNIYVIFLADNLAVQDAGFGVTMCEPAHDNAFGYHWFFNTAAGHPCYYAIIPGLTNACLTNSCPSDATCSLHLAETQEQRQTQVASHEIAEMISDPQLTAWTDNASGEENGDLCNGVQGSVTVGPNTWKVQKMYSKYTDDFSNGALTCIDNPAFQIPTYNVWNVLPGAAKDIGVGANGNVWVIGTNVVPGGYGIYSYNLLANTWTSHPGGAVRIDVDPAGNPWVINSNNNIFKWNGTGWTTMPGAAVDIGIGANGSVWVIGTNPVGGGYGIYQWNGTGWTNHPGGAVKIDIDPNGNPWVINSANQIFEWDGYGWILHPGAATDIGIGGDGSVWVIGANAVGGGYGIFRWNGIGWDEMPGGAVAISAGPGGAPWVVNSVNNIFRWG